MRTMMEVGFLVMKEQQVVLFRPGFVYCKTTGEGTSAVIIHAGALYTRELRCCREAVGASRFLSWLAKFRMTAGISSTKTVTRFICSRRAAAISTYHTNAECTAPRKEDSHSYHTLP